MVMANTDPQADLMPPRDRTLADWVRVYRNDRLGNTEIHGQFDELARAPDWLAKHRDWVEANEWGFGDRAFHHMWLILLEHLARRGGPVSCLEIGVFKGQVISLWALIGARRRLPLAIAALSPFSSSGAPVLRNRLVKKVLKLFSPAYREDLISGNIYAPGDYLGDCERIFQEFGQDFGKVEVIRGFSTDPAILASLDGRRFDLIFVDGDHSEAGAMHDVKSFAPLVSPGGFIVMDDSALSLESDLPYRGRPGASKAADMLPSMGFTNILNIGHDRIFRKD
jgi:predicted O-methyltransferase YrrM